MQLNPVFLLVLTGLGSYSSGGLPMIPQSDPGEARYEVLERSQDPLDPKAYSIAVSVDKILTAEDTKTIICKIWQADLALKDPEFSVITLYYGLTRDEYVPGAALSIPPSPIERKRSAHRFATYRWSNIVKPPMRQLMMTKNVDRSVIVPVKVVTFDSAKDCASP